jgi:hypothetical protein
MPRPPLAPGQRPRQWAALIQDGPNSAGCTKTEFGRLQRQAGASVQPGLGVTLGYDHGALTAGRVEPD